jgi:hypothetical protein
VDPGGWTFANAFEEALHRGHAVLAGDGGVDHGGKAAGTGRTHQRARRDEVGK